MPHMLAVKCRVCGCDVERRGTRGSHPEYCGASCRSKAYAARQRAARKSAGCRLCGAPTELRHVYCGPCARIAERMAKQRKLQMPVEQPMQTRLLNPDAPTLRHEDWMVSNPRTRPCVDCGAIVQGSGRGAVAKRCHACFLKHDNARQSRASRHAQRRQRP